MFNKTASFGMISSTTFTFANVMIGSFVSSQTSTEPYVAFQDVTHMNDIWRVLQDPILNNLYSTWYDGNPNITMENLVKYVSNENRVLGLARLRQLRVNIHSRLIYQA